MKVIRARYETFKVKQSKRLARDRGQAIALGEKLHVERRCKDRKFKKEINKNPKRLFIFIFFLFFILILQKKNFD